MKMPLHRHSAPSDSTMSHTVTARQFTTCALRNPPNAVIEKKVLCETNPFATEALQEQV